MKSWFPFLLLLLFLASCRKADIGPTGEVTCQVPDSVVQHPRNERLEELMSRYVRKGLPGMSILIRDKDGLWVGSAGYADLDKKIEFKPCHVSKAASITKLFMGVVTFRLQEEGKLDLDDPLETWIDPDILKKIDKASGKTIRQLMNHTTGIFDVITSNDFYLAVLNNPNKTWTQEELLHFVYGEDGYGLGDPYAAHYSNTNTLLLSMCLEKAGGKPQLELLHQYILGPLGLNDTYLQGREPIPSSAAQGYFDLHNNGSIANVSNLITGSGNGYGGLYSNVYDLDRFIRALLVDKVLLSQASLDEMMQEFVREDEDFYTGCGIIKKFTLKPHAGVGHTGRDLGYSADLFYFPDTGDILVFFVNYGTNGDSDLKPVFLNFESELVDVLQE